MNISKNTHNRNATIIEHIITCLNSDNKELAETTEIRLKQEITLPIKRNKKHQPENTMHRFLITIEKYQIEIAKNNNDLTEFRNDTINARTTHTPKTITILKALNAKGIHTIQDITNNNKLMSRRKLQNNYETSINKTQHEFLKNINIQNNQNANTNTTKTREKITKIDNEEIIAATDGSSNNNGTGYGIIIYDKDKNTLKEIKHSIKKTDTAQRAELLAATLALKLTKKNSTITLITDSKYVLNVINKKQLTTKTKDNQDVINAINHLKKSRKITVVKIESHTDNTDFATTANKRADELANEGRIAKSNKTLNAYITKHRPKYYIKQHETPIWNIKKMLQEIEREENIRNIKRLVDPQTAIIKDKDFDRKLSNAYLQNKQIPETARTKMWKHRIRVNRCNEYLYTIGRIESPNCAECGKLDHHGHKITECTEHDTKRIETTAKINIALKEAESQKEAHVFWLKEEVRQGKCNIEATGAILKQTKDDLIEEVGIETTKTLVNKIQEIIAKSM